MIATGMRIALHHRVGAEGIVHPAIEGGHRAIGNLYTAAIESKLVAASRSRTCALLLSVSLTGTWRSRAGSPGTAVGLGPISANSRRANSTCVASPRVMRSTLPYRQREVQRTESG
ncbi:MAG: hypothetical protein ABI327_08810, partial [Burkholderiaceae bacterium]